MEDLVIRNGLIVTDNGVIRGGLAVRSGRKQNKEALAPSLEYFAITTRNTMHSGLHFPPMIGFSLLNHNYREVRWRPNRLYLANLNMQSRE